MSVTETKDLTAAITKLIEGNAYFIRVAAKNEIGQGKFAELPEAVTCKSPYGE